MELTKLSVLVVVLLTQYSLVVDAAPTIKYFNSSYPFPRWSTYSNGTGRLAIYKPDRGTFMRSYFDYYQHGKFTARIRLHQGFSAGIAATYYLRSHGTYWDEIDFEFLGNTDSKNIILHTNYFAQGKGGNEEQYQFWFDPAADYHDYTIWWTKEFIAWMVDDIVIRVVNRNPFAPYSAPGFVKQPMLAYASIWDASGWASNGGAIKSDYSKGPFFIYFGDVDFSQTCLKVKKSSCPLSSKNAWDVPLTKEQLIVMNQYRKKYLTFSHLFPR